MLRKRAAVIGTGTAALLLSSLLTTIRTSLLTTIRTSIGVITSRYALTASSGSVVLLALVSTGAVGVVTAFPPSSWPSPLISPPTTALPPALLSLRDHCTFLCGGRGDGAFPEGDNKDVHRSFLKDEQRTCKGRRQLLQDFLVRASSAVIASGTLIGTTSSNLAVAATSSLSLPSSRARIVKYPGLEYLEPIYELQLSVQALKRRLLDGNDDVEGTWLAVKQRLDAFFSGGIFSERSYYAGLGVQYMNQIQYDRNEITEFIRLDKESRFNSMEECLQSLNSIKNEFKKYFDGGGGSTRDSAAATIRDEILNAEVALDRWFALVPEQDYENVVSLYVAARKADTNRDGKLSDQELQLLDETSREIWKKRIRLVGG